MVLNSTKTGNKKETKADKMEVEKKIEEFKRYYETLTLKQMKRVTQELNRVRDQKYDKSRGKKYGDLDKALTEEQFRQLIEAEKRPHYRMAYLIMANTGLRVNEMVNVKKQDILDDYTIVLRICKNSYTNDCVKIPKSLRPELDKYLRDYKEDIDRTGGYLIFTNNKNYPNKPMSREHLSLAFRETTMRLGFNYVYHRTENEKTGSRALYVYSTHSLRRLYSKRVYNKVSKDSPESVRLEILRKAMRHRDYSTLQTYLQEDKNKAFEIMENL